jgi:RNA polymerase sigma-70 factor (ECF subfamily)
MSLLTSTLSLIRKAQAGDRRAFGGLVVQYQPQTQALIHVRLGPRLRRFVEPADIEQEVYIRAYQSISQFEWRGDGSFFRWLGGITEHVIKDQARLYLKSQKHGQEYKMPSPGPTPAATDVFVSHPTPSVSLRRQERLERLEKALDGLSEDYREVIILARIRRLPLAEIGRRMNRSADAVSMLLLRALRKLRLLFGETESLSLPPGSLDRPSAPDDR